MQQQYLLDEAPALRIDQRPVQDVPAFVLAGNAIFTVVSRKTKARFTFRVRKPEKAPTAGSNAPTHFVAVLTGSNNDSDYTYLGLLRGAQYYEHGKRSRIGPTADSAKAAAWFFANFKHPALATVAEVFHEGRCCRCGRRLTVPSSIESGIGPECALHVGGNHADHS